MAQLALQALVVSMMVSVGFELSPRDLGEGLARWRAAVVTVLLNLVVFPLGVLGVVLRDDTLFPEGVAIGLLVCAVAPGGPTGPLFARMGGGDLKFATAMMCLLVVLGLLTAPAMLEFLAGGPDGEPGGIFWPAFKMLAGVQLLPLAVGMGVRRLRRDLAERLAGPTGIVANVLLVAIIVGYLIDRGELLLSISPAAHGVLIVMLLPLLIPLLASRDPSGVLRSAGVVTAVRNLSVALLLASTLFEDPSIEMGILLWGFWMMVLPGVAAAWRRKRNRSEGA